MFHDQLLRGKNVCVCVYSCKYMCMYINVNVGISNFRGVNVLISAGFNVTIVTSQAMAQFSLLSCPELAVTQHWALTSFSHNLHLVQM